VNDTVNVRLCSLYWISDIALLMRLFIGLRQKTHASSGRGMNGVLNRLMSKHYVAHKFRLKPTEEQAETLESWSGHLSAMAVS
jgi:hypothetical protein